MEEIVLQGDDGEDIPCYVLAQTVLGGRTYILTADTAEGDGEALILRDDSAPEAPEGLYRIVEDEAEQMRAAAAFRELLADEEIELRD